MITRHQKSKHKPGIRKLTLIKRNRVRPSHLFQPILTAREKQRFFVILLIHFWLAIVTHSNFFTLLSEV